MRFKNIGLGLGLFLFISILLLPPPEGIQTEAKYVLAITALMATWWISEAIPIPATALLPILLFPLLGIMSTADVTQAYAHHLIYLFLGGFLIAATIEKWNLHKRIALSAILLIGNSANKIILTFMLVTATLSMWITNTAATMLMMTIALAVLKQVKDEIDNHKELNIDTSTESFRFGTCFILSIAYAASIGGIATLIGTPPNAVFAGLIESYYSLSISFLDWMLLALPLSMTMLFICWFYLTRIAFPSEIKELPDSRNIISQQLNELGQMSKEEKYVTAIFLLVAFLWLTHGLVEHQWTGLINDSTIAIGGAILLFIIPSNLKKREFLLDWKTASRIPWDILILFGGGFALAKGFKESGLTLAIAEHLQYLQGSDLLVVVLCITSLVIFLTEITSNTATASLLLPVIGALSIAMHLHPYALMIAATLSASFAFMLPVATPPNAIVFSSRYITIQQMVKAGFWINLVGILIITLFAVFILPHIWDINFELLPKQLG